MLHDSDALSAIFPENPGPIGDCSAELWNLKIPEKPEQKKKKKNTSKMKTGMYCEKSHESKQIMKFHPEYSIC